MKITALEEYGLRCMVQLARNKSDSPLTLPDFTKKEGLSIAYAGKLMMILKKAGLVKASRGRKGGYTLTRTPEKISLNEIFEALGDRLFPTAFCGEHSGVHKICVNHKECRIRDIWQNVDSFFGRIFEKITLVDIAEGKLDLLESILKSGKPDSITSPNDTAIAEN